MQRHQRRVLVAFAHRYGGNGYQSAEVMRFVVAGGLLVVLTDIDDVVTEKLVGTVYI